MTYGEDGKRRGREKGTTDLKQPGQPAGWSLLACHVAAPVGASGGGCTHPLDAGGSRGKKGGDGPESERGMATNNYASTRQRKQTNKLEWYSENTDPPCMLKSKQKKKFPLRKNV